MLFKPFLTFYAWLATPNCGKKSHQTSKTGVRFFALVTAMILTLSACTTSHAPLFEKIVSPKTSQYSTAPIVKVSKRDALFAQTALKKLGYNIGEVDGFWGPRSAREIRKFESKQKIATANGYLSALSLHRLAKASGISSKDVVSKTSRPAKAVAKATQSQASNSQATNKDESNEASSLSAGEPTDITAQIDKTVPLSSAPQLIIVERPYRVLAKPNPYSEQIATLQAGTGIYVLSLQDGWYEIESLNRLRGYVWSDQSETTNTKAF